MASDLFPGALLVWRLDCKRSRQHRERIAILRQKFFVMAVGDDYDPTDTRYRPMLDSINATAQAYWAKMNPAPVSNAVGGSYVGLSQADDSAD